MLFSHIEILVWHEEMISLMKVGQFLGHSCFKMDTRTRLSLLTNVLCAFKDSSDEDDSMIWLTTKFRIPSDPRQ